MKSSLYVFLVSIVCLIQLSCAQLRRSNDSGYRNSDWNQDVSREPRPRKSAIERAEQDLQGRYERDQYFKNRAYLKTDEERLEFLSLGSIEEREKFLDKKGIDGNATAHPPSIQGLVDINDITIGMTKQAVRDSWGEPELVEVAGNPLYGNERWHYDEQVSSAEGFRSEKRMVYFESGKVVGWQTN